MKNENYRRAFVWIAMAGLLGWIVSASAFAGEGNPVKLTMLLPMTGAQKEVGAMIKNGFFLGVDQESARLGVDLKQWVEIEVLDSRADPKVALPLAKDAVARGTQAILGVVSMDVGTTIEDFVLNDAKIPLIVCGACPAIKIRSTNPLFLRTTFSAYQITIGLTAWLKNHPVKPSTGAPLKWACAHMDFGVEFCDGFKLGYEPMGQEAGRVSVPYNTANMQPYLIGVSKLQPDFTFAFFAGLENELFVKGYYQFGMQKKAPLTMLGTVLTPLVLKNFEATLDQYNTGVGILNASPWFPKLNNPENTLFLAQYQQAYGTPPGVYAVHGYDTGRMLVNALAQLQGKWDALKVMELLRATPVNSARTGKPLTFDTHGDPILPMYIFQTKREGKSIVNEFLGETPPINTDEYLK